MSPVAGDKRVSRRQWLTTSVGVLAGLFAAISARTVGRVIAAPSQPAETATTTVSLQNTTLNCGGTVDFRLLSCFTHDPATGKSRWAIIRDNQVVGWTEVPPLGLGTSGASA